MAIPLIGSLSDLNQSQGMALASQRYLGESLTKMGAQIGETISQRQMFSDADKAAPFMQHAFLDAFDTIAGGDINGGLGKAIGAAAQYATNPILARIAQEGVRTAGLMTNTVMEQFQQENQNYRTQLGIDAFDQRTDAKLDIATEKAAAGLQEELRKRQEIINNPIVPDEAKVQAKAEADSIVTQLQAMQTQPLPTQQQSNEPDVTIVNEDFVGPMPQGSSTPDPTPLTQPMGAVGRVGNVQPPQQSAQPAGSPTAAPQAQGVATQSQADPSYAIFGDEQTQRAMGGNIFITNQSGNKMSLEGMTVKDGGVSMAFKSADGSKLFDLGKEATDAANTIISGASTINSDINAFLESSGGLINLSAIDFKGADETGYTMSVKTPIKRKDGKTEIIDREYVSYDENGKQIPVMVSKEEKANLDKMEESAGLLKKTFNQKGAILSAERGKGTPEDVRFTAMQEEANRPYPFQMDIKATLTALGSNPEAMKGGDILVFKSHSSELLDRMVKDKEFVDKNGTEIPVKDQAAKFQKKLKEESKNWKNEKGEAMFNKENAKVADSQRVIAEIGLDPSVAKAVGESQFAGLGEFLGGITGAAGKAIGKQFKASAVDKQFAPIQSRLYQLYSSGKLTKEAYEANKEKVREAKKKALDLIKNS